MAVNKHPGKRPPGTRLAHYVRCQNFPLGGRGPCMGGCSVGVADGMRAPWLCWEWVCVSLVSTQRGHKTSAG